MTDSGEERKPEAETSESSGKAGEEGVPGDPDAAAPAGPEPPPDSPGRIPSAESADREASPDPDTAPAPPLPAIADDTDRHLAPGHISWNRTVLWMVTGNAALGLAIGVLIVFATVDVLIWPRLLAAGIWLVITGPLLGITLKWPALEHRHTTWRVSAERVEYRHGVIWKTATSVPRSRVQHTDVRQGPLERHFGIARLIIHTAGTEHAIVTLRGLEPEIAREIRDFLLPGESGAPV